MSTRSVGLANNHALDFGEQALKDTAELLNDAGIATAGAGLGRDAARQAAVVLAVCAPGRPLTMLCARGAGIRYRRALGS